jgi:CRP-like cAMP-binding protein
MVPPFLKDFVRAHSSMPDERIAELAPHFTPVTIEQGQHLLHAGTVNDRYLVVAEGWLRSYTLDIDGDEVTTAFSGPMTAVFDVDSFFMRTASLESIVAISRVTGAELSFAGLNHLFHTYPEFREMGRMILVKGFAALKRRTLSMINLSAEERYGLLMKTQPELFQYAQLKQIASYLGVTDTSLSRIRREYVKA